MPISSSEISQQIGAFQQQSMGQMQHASMLSQNVGAGHMASGMMGSMTNTAAAIGAPMAGFGLAMAGMDPMSLGLRVGMGSVGRMGVMGGIGMGAAAAGVSMLPIMAAQYAGGQMLGGMQQQQQLDETLRSSFGAGNNIGRGGFSTGQMGQIGGMMRQQAGTFGPHNQMATFGELTQLAGGMAEMGMMPRSGIGGPNIQEFTTRFKSMLREVKEIATAFNTTLTEAQQVMGSMRQSGVFSGQGQVARDIRQMSLASGLAVTEFAAMGSIGSQISRSVGGRGRAGAVGGMHTLGQIGIANQMGLVSDEDIYNVTGLTGAEGRQAYAGQQMQQSASFLQTGLGRRFMASMAGKNGTLDSASAMKWMTGGMGTGETMASAGGNLNKVGRANFIRNEARMRGAVLEKFGGLADVTAASGWLESRGMDVNDDRSNVWLQRRMGWTEEQTEQKLKIMRALPQLQEKAMVAGEESEFQERFEQQKSRTGIRGVKRKLEEFRNKVNNSLQQAGSDVYKWGENTLERWINGMTGEYYESISRDVGEAVHSITSGTPLKAEEASRRLGFSGRSAATGAFLNQAMQKVYGGSLLSEGQRSTRTLDAFKEMDSANFKRAGYFVGTESVGRMQSGIEMAQRTYDAAMRGSAGLEGPRESSFREMGAGAREHVRDLVTSGRFIGRGDELLTAMRETFSKNSSVAGWSRLKASADELKGPEGAAKAADILRGAGVSEDFIEKSFGVPSVRSLSSQLGGARTETDAARMIGDYAFGGGAGTEKPLSHGELLEKQVTINTRSSELMEAHYGPQVMLNRMKQLQRAAENAAYNPNSPGSQKVLSDLLKTGGRAADKSLVGLWTQTRKEAAEGIEQGGVTGAGGLFGIGAVGALRRGKVSEAFGRYTMGEEGQRLMRGALSSSATDRAAAAEEAADLSEKLQSELKSQKSENTTPEQLARANALNAIRSAPDFLSLAEKERKGTLTDADKKQFEDTHKMQFDDARRLLEAGGAAMTKQEMADQQEALRRIKGIGREAVSSMSRTGMAVGGALSEQGLAAFGKGAGTTGKAAASKFVEAQGLFAEGKVEEGRAKLSEEFSAFAGMDVQAQRGYIQNLTSLGGAGAEQAMQYGQLQKQGMMLSRYGAGRGAEGIARSLGAQMSPELQRKLLGKSGEEAANMIMAEKGISTDTVSGELADDYRKKIMDAQKLQAAGKGTEAAGILSGLHGGKAETIADEKQKQATAEKDPSYQMLSRMAGSMKNMEAKLNSGLIVQVGNVPIPTKDVAASPEDRRA